MLFYPRPRNDAYTIISIRAIDGRAARCIREVKDPRLMASKMYIIKPLSRGLWLVIGVQTMTYPNRKSAALSVAEFRQHCLMNS